MATAQAWAWMSRKLSCNPGMHDLQFVPVCKPAPIAARKLATLMEKQVQIVLSIAPPLRPSNSAG